MHRISSCHYKKSTLGFGPDFFLEFEVYENEDFAARKSFDSWPGRKLNLVVFSMTGDEIYREELIIGDVSYEGGFDWSVRDQLFTWAVSIGANKEIKELE